MLHHLPFVVFHHRGQLLQVANEQQLHPAEGAVVASVAAHDRVDGVEQVGAHHAYLVDHEQVERAQYVAFHLAKLVAALLFCPE